MYLARDYKSFNTKIDPEEKKCFHEDAKKLLKETGKILETRGFKTIQIHSNLAGSAISGAIYLDAIQSDETINREHYRGIHLICTAWAWDRNNPRSDSIRLIAHQAIYLKNPKTYNNSQNGENHHVSPDPNLDPKALSQWLLDIYQTGSALGHYKTLIDPATFDINNPPQIPILKGSQPTQLSLF